MSEATLGSAGSPTLIKSFPGGASLAPYPFKGNTSKPMRPLSRCGGRWPWVPGTYMGATSVDIDFDARLEAALAGRTSV